MNKDVLEFLMREVTQCLRKNREAFEAKIAYFFGVSDQKTVVEAYINALKNLEEIGSNSPIKLLKQEIVPYLEDAYKSNAQQKR